MYKRVTGTRDILPEEVLLWQKLEEISRRVFATFNYLEIRTPVIEEAGLFNRSLGQTSDIVQKQMFQIQREDESYCLRPEATAAIARAYIENNLQKKSSFVKLYYIGPMFRAERPQKGRLRQFHHAGCEAIGSISPQLDAEVITLADALLGALSISGYKIRINSLGCLSDKNNITHAIRRALGEKIAEFCPDCQRRFENNPLRILDCKQERCKKALDGLDIGNSHLCAPCREHFESVRRILDSSHIGYEIAPRLVRGLDYYTRTVFEITHEGLGSQDALGAGGRYDNLIKDLGGLDTPAVGFALGIERLLLVKSQMSDVRSQKNLVYLITLGQEAKKEGCKLLRQIRNAGIACDTDYEDKSLKGAMRKAQDLGAEYVLIIGDNELKTNSITIKEMATGEQREIAREKIIETINR